MSRKKVKKKFVLTNNFFFVTSIQFVACALRENLSNRSSGVQIPRDICTRFGCYLYSTKCSWITIDNTWENTIKYSGVSKNLQQEGNYQQKTKSKACDKSTCFFFLRLSVNKRTLPLCFKLTNCHECVYRTELSYHASTSAPFSNKALQHFKCPSIAARCRGVLDTSSSSFLMEGSFFTSSVTALYKINGQCNDMIF